MPANDPGKVTRPQAITLVAYMLQAGRFPAGKDALSNDASLKQIGFPGGAPAVGAPAAGGAAQALAMQPMGDLAQIMRGILFPSSNLIFTVQSQDPGAPKPPLQTGGGWLQLGGLGRRHLSRLGAGRLRGDLDRRCCAAAACAAAM